MTDKHPATRPRSRVRPSNQQGPDGIRGATRDHGQVWMQRYASCEKALQRLGHQFHTDANHSPGYMSALMWSKPSEDDVFIAEVSCSIGKISTRIVSVLYMHANTRAARSRLARCGLETQSSVSYRSCRDEHRSVPVAVWLALPKASSFRVPTYGPGRQDNA